MFSGIFVLEGRSEVIWGGMLFLAGVCLFLVCTVYRDTTPLRRKHFGRWKDMLMSLPVTLDERWVVPTMLTIIGFAFCLPYVSAGLSRGTLTFGDALTWIGAMALLIYILDFCIFYIVPFLLWIMLPKEKDDSLEEVSRTGYVFTKARTAFLLSGVGAGVCSIIAYGLNLEMLASLSAVVALVSFAHMA
jgi:hypothetical protein